MAITSVTPPPAGDRLIQTMLQDYPMSLSGSLPPHRGTLAPDCRGTHSEAPPPRTSRLNAQHSLPHTFLSAGLAHKARQLTNTPCSRIRNIFKGHTLISQTLANPTGDVECLPNTHYYHRDALGNTDTFHRSLADVTLTRQRHVWEHCLTSRCLHRLRRLHPDKWRR
ncbi:hypothetical protein E2C01_070323 [Portunus trituberculatus]|uniref:Uncharacterized protein n=1 Tax=Portunus trituberculatus TaxID=210409 RepID=A0A5B7I100_PORTR|nr:hypothetical protein [Portunus trituberculatus]